VTNLLLLLCTCTRHHERTELFMSIAIACDKCARHPSGFERGDTWSYERIVGGHFRTAEWCNAEEPGITSTTSPLKTASPNVRRRATRQLQLNDILVQQKVVKSATKVRHMTFLINKVGVSSRLNPCCWQVTSRRRCVHVPQVKLQKPCPQSTWLTKHNAWCRRYASRVARVFN
jgi:hypothetical protein